MSVFVTGDIHGCHTIRKFATRNFDPTGLTDDDYVIIAGDFGLLWNEPGTHGYAEDQYWLGWLDSKPWTTLFVDGNHENFPMLNQSSFEMTWHGGRVHQVGENIYHLMRGEVFDLCGKRFFTMGGAYSHDKDYRIEGRSWWPEEVPSQDERMHAIKTLEGVGWDVDYVVTHDAPADVARNIIRDYSGRCIDEYEEWLQESIERRLAFDRWFFGHQHQDTPKCSDKRFTALYNRIVKVVE